MQTNFSAGWFYEAATSFEDEIKSFHNLITSVEQKRIK
jgi:hypothetical protein